MCQLDIKLINIILPIIYKYFPDISLDRNIKPISFSIVDAIGRCIIELNTPKDKLKWCKCFNEMYSICKIDVGNSGLMNYFEIFLGESPNIGSKLIKDPIYLQYLDNQIIELWQHVN